MSKTERFEMRLETEIIGDLDAWRDANMPGASRAQAVRELIRLGLNSTTNASSPRFSDGEKTVIRFMKDLFEHVGAPIKKIDVLLDGFSSGYEWVADLEMGHLYNSDSTSVEDVNFVLETLEMWDLFERAFDSFSDDEKAIVLDDTDGETALRDSGKEPESREIKFEGFSAESEPNLVGIATFIVEKMRRFPRFAGRNLVSSKSPKETNNNIGAKLRFYDHLKPSLIGRLPSPEEVRKFSLASGIPWEQAKALMVKQGRLPDDNNK